MKRILILNSHPHPRASFGGTLADAYARGAADAGAEIETLNLGDLDFDPILRAGYGHEQALEPDLIRLQQAIERAHHIAFVFPVWWGTLPALIKGAIDRAMTTGWAYRYEEDQTFPTRLLTGRTARIISTMDAPSWWYRLKYRRSAHTALRASTLDFVGIKTVGETTLYKVRELDDEARAGWARKLEAQARADVARIKPRSEGAPVRSA